MKTASEPRVTTFRFLQAANNEDNNDNDDSKSHWPHIWDTFNRLMFYRSFVSFLPLFIIIEMLQTRKQVLFLLIFCLIGHSNDSAFYLYI